MLVCYLRSPRWLVAAALAGRHTVVTHEVASPTLKRIKIPNVCVGLGIEFMNPYQMLRKEREEARLKELKAVLEKRGADLVSITSWNEWGEGTQIEPARVPADDVGDHMDYGANPDLYLDITREATERLRNRSPPDL